MRLLIAFLMMFFAAPSFAALSNANNPHMECVSLGSPSADVQVFAGIHSKGIRITGAYLLNGAGIAASDTDFFQLEVKKGSTVVAELDSRAAHENGITSSVGEALNLVTAQRDVNPATVLYVNYNETDSGTAVALTTAMVCIQYSVK